MRKTPLERWIAETVLVNHTHQLTMEDIRRYQLEKLRAVVDFAQDKSPFYQKHLKGLSSKYLRHLGDLFSFPFTIADDLQQRGPEFLCVSQGEVERVVTLQQPNQQKTLRRVYFSRNDLEHTIDFFHYGMTTLVKPGQRVLILMPGDRPGSVGNLLAKALSRAGAQGVAHGPVLDPALTIRDIVEMEIDCLVAIPTQALALARHEQADEILSDRIKTVLLSADYVPSSVVRELRHILGCQVFGHYGTTEMGFGGGVECEALYGYHLREADLLFEIVDPASGKPLADGEQGEIVFTTLTRDAMPLLRYRTGDLSRFLNDPCPCGTVLRRLEKVRGKVHELVSLRSGDWLGIADLDEAIFTVPGIVNYKASLTRTHAVDRLELLICRGSRGHVFESEEILRAVARVPAIASAVNTGQLVLEPIRLSGTDWINSGVVKRSISVKDE